MTNNFPVAEWLQCRAEWHICHASWVQNPLWANTHEIPQFMEKMRRGHVVLLCGKCSSDIEISLQKE